MKKHPLPPGFQDMLGVGLVEVLLGRRSRRFFLGAEIPDGVFPYKSKHPPLPLSELVPSMFVIMYLQAHHLDLEFYNTFYHPGSYLRTHAAHLRQWHPEI